MPLFSATRSTARVAFELIAPSRRGALGCADERTARRAARGPGRPC